MGVLINWGSEYSVSEEILDNQHQNLIGIINKLYKAFLEANSSEIIFEILTEMVKYSKYHFITEEEYFNKLDYEHASLHIAQHKEFIEKVTNFMKDYENKSVTLSFDVMNFLKDWLVNHILKTDKEYEFHNIKN